MLEGVAENEAAIIEKDATILDNISNNDEKPDENMKTPAAPELPVRLKPPTPKRGRPQGSKDRVPRRRVRIEPIPQPVEQPVEQQAPSPSPAQTAPARTPTPTPASPPSPPSPRTLYRQTSEQLLSLRDLVTHQRRTQAAERYVNNLHSWTGF